MSLHIFMHSTVLFNSLKDTVLLARLSYFIGIRILVGRYLPILLSKTLFEVKTLHEYYVIFMPIKIRNADLHERFSPIFDEQCIKSLLQ